MLNEKPDVTSPSDVQDSERRKEVVHHEEVVFGWVFLHDLLAGHMSGTGLKALNCS